MDDSTAFIIGSDSSLLGEQQMTKTPLPIQPSRISTRIILAVGVLFLVVALLSATLTIPFLFESPSMFYKFGWDKALLRAGKMVGLAAAFLVLLQMPLAGRLKWLDRIFSLPSLYTAHRFVAYTIVTLVLIHPVLVFIPDKILMIPFEARYWPEWVGAGLLVIILLQFGMARWRRNIFRAYQKWLLLHRMLGIGAMALLTLHILYVSETFEHDGLPRNLVLVTAAMILTLWLWIRVRGKLMQKKDFHVERVETAGKNAHTIDLKSGSAQPLSYLPGQFAFLSFDARHISNEPHPFTISSSPLRPDTLQFSIRDSGDWTGRINGLRVGDRATVQGPFGHFSHLIVSPRREIIMIAGGIGITPMLSMLRYMTDTDDQRRITLIWSNQTPHHLFSEQELDAMAEQLTDFNWVPTFTREKSQKGKFGRLDRHKLESLLQSHDRDAAVFLCGPPKMIQQLRKDLKHMGFQNRSVHFEAFGF